MDEHYMRQKVYQRVSEIMTYLLNAQKEDGSWHFCFEDGTLTDAYMIILLRHLDIQDEAYINELAWRIISKQEPSGTWKLFYDEPEGNLSATIQCYYALLLAGHRKKDDADMKKAKDFILSKGGPAKADSLTRIMLALTGHYSWDGLPDIPVEIILLPTWLPINFFDMVGYARVHSVPILICADKKYVLKIPGGPELADLFSLSIKQVPRKETPQILLIEIQKIIKSIALSLDKIHALALRKLERHMLARTEWDGTLYSYFTTTFLMIFALLALGYEKGHPVITKAIAGLKALACSTGKNIHQQETTSTVWDTALITYALQEGGLLYSHLAIIKAASYLLGKQQTQAGDWQIYNQRGRPGGWGFSHSNTINPDVDDTSYSLRALYRLAVNYSGFYGASWRAGLEWLSTMQNNDGGWPAFEKNTNKKWPEYLPFAEAEAVLTDPSSSDLTGRTLELLGNYAGMSFEQDQVQKGVQWLLSNQEADGYWFGRWGICYIYGTWASVTGLIAVGIGLEHRAIKKAIDWLLSIQNSDGGWGESCLSDLKQQYVPLSFSTPSQTAWALDALIVAGLQENPAVIRGMEALLNLVEKNGLETSYPTGAGLPGGFYIHYHSYRYIWPLIAFSHYLRRA